MIDAATKGKHCNASCCDYYCPQNVSGRCQAPNKCLGVEEAAELMAELEAAKREIAALRKRERGDCAKLREVCEKMLDLLTAEGFEDGGMSIELDEKQVIMWRNRFRAALSAPPRNCDVGDAADWEKRFGEECDKGHICSDCPVRCAKTRMAIELDKGARCEFVWAQMPYEEGV